MRQKLSLCMIVKNEEKMLPGCLESVRGVVDEIVVVDTGSTDSTKSIAERHGALIVDFLWCDDFSAARNESLRRAHGDWILYLDADERLGAEQGKILKELLEDSSAGAYLMWIRGQQSLGEGDVALRNTYPRLFRNRKDLRFEGRVHEQITPALERCGAAIRSTDLVIEHLGYDQGYGIVAEKARRNNALLLKQVQENPDDSYARFQLGNSQSILGEYDAAYETLTQVLATKKLSSGVAASALNILAEIEIRHDQMERAIEHARRSLELAENQMLARWFLAVALAGNKEHAKALNVLLVLHPYTVKRGSIPAFDVIIEPWKVQFQIALCQQEMGLAADAMKSLRQAQGYHRRDEKLYLTEIRWLMEASNLDGVSSTLERAYHSDVLSFRLFQHAIDGASKAGAWRHALAFLRYMGQTIPEQIPAEVRPRLEALALKLAQLV